MKKKIKTIWVRALRSGKYQQCSDVLSNGPQFCCLGVLCDLAVKNKIIKKPKIDEDGKLLYAKSAYYLPKTVMRWAGLKHEKGDAVKIGIGDALELSDHNDNKVSFEMIADAIEEQL